MWELSPSCDCVRSSCLCVQRARDVLRDCVVCALCVVSAVCWAGSTGAASWSWSWSRRWWMCDDTFALCLAAWRLSIHSITQPIHPSIQPSVFPSRAHAYICGHSQRVRTCADLRSSPQDSQEHASVVACFPAVLVAALYQCSVYAINADQPHAKALFVCGCWPLQAVHRLTTGRQSIDSQRHQACW